MKPRTATLLASALAALALTACSGRVLDYRNMTVSGGKIYAQNSDTPFSGKVTNVPFQEAIETNGSLALVYRLIGTKLPSNTICDLSVTNGYRNGDAVCRDERDNTKYYEVSFKGGRLYGDVNIYSASSHGKPVVTATIGDKGLDGALKAYREKDHALVYKGDFSDGVNQASEIYYPDTGSVRKTFTVDENGQTKGTVVDYTEDGKKLNYIYFGVKVSVGFNSMGYTVYPDTGNIKACFAGPDPSATAWMFSWNEKGVINTIPEHMDPASFSGLLENCKEHLPPNMPDADKVKSTLDGLLTKNTGATASSGPLSTPEAAAAAINGEDRSDWPKEDNACTQSWADAYRKARERAGLSDAVTYDIAWEWVDNCRAGKRPD